MYNKLSFNCKLNAAYYIWSVLQFSIWLVMCSNLLGWPVYPNNLFDQLFSLPTMQIYVIFNTPSSYFMWQTFYLDWGWLAESTCLWVLKMPKWNIGSAAGEAGGLGGLAVWAGASSFRCLWRAFYTRCVALKSSTHWVVASPTLCLSLLRCFFSMC